MAKSFSASTFARIAIFRARATMEIANIRRITRSAVTTTVQIVVTKKKMSAWARVSMLGKTHEWGSGLQIE